MRHRQLIFQKKGYIDVADADKVTATNNGIAVSLIQTISDKKSYLSIFES